MRVCALDKLAIVSHCVVTQSKELTVKTTRTVELTAPEVEAIRSEFAANADAYADDPDMVSAVKVSNIPPSSKYG